TAFIALEGVLEGVAKRQTRTCLEVLDGPNLCERSCGPEFVECIYKDNCYNPGRGYVCCSDGRVCPAGSYCTNVRCCPDGISHEECGATATLSIIPLPAMEEPRNY
ncbi:hypothetical protein IWW34DRAFT_641681, partial [Fusarium oxysporum f. sp. albedinis]